MKQITIDQNVDSVKTVHERSDKKELKTEVQNVLMTGHHVKVKFFMSILQDSKKSVF